MIAHGTTMQLSMMTVLSFSVLSASARTVETLVRIRLCAGTSVYHKKRTVQDPADGICTGQASRTYPS